VTFVYILECADGSYYTGWTTDLDRRVAAHNAGQGGRYTRSRRPVKLVYWEEHPDRRSAQRRELALKRLPRARKLALIAEFKTEVIDH
jgi:putative endonuclease